MLHFATFNLLTLDNPIIVAHLIILLKCCHHNTRIVEFLYTTADVIYRDHAWAQREAYLELERREKAGLPLIDPNMIDPANIDLPSEEELADFEIII